MNMFITGRKGVVATPSYKKILYMHYYMQLTIYIPYLVTYRTYLEIYVPYSFITYLINALFGYI